MAADTPVVKVIRKGKPYPFDFDELEIQELDADQYAAGDRMAAEKSHLLFSVPGAGKTWTACHALAVVMETRKEPTRVLIVCPTIACRTWFSWVGATYLELGKSTQIEVLASSNHPVTAGTEVLIVTHALLSRWGAAIRRTVEGFKADVLIVDESDAFTGLESARTAALFGKGFTGGIAGPIEWAWFLTGTPIPRYQDGLYPVLRNRFANRLSEFGVLSQSRFLARFCQTRLVKVGGMRFPRQQVNGSKDISGMEALLKPIHTRLRLNLTKPVEVEVALEVPFSHEFKKLEHELTEAENDGLVSYLDSRLATALKLMGRDAAPMVARHVDTILAEKRNNRDSTGILVLYWHKEVGRILELALSKTWNCCRIDGSTGPAANEKAEDGFNGGVYDVCLGQIAAMGVALNLQRNCDTVVFAEDTFSDAKNLQAKQRVWRRGQEKLVTIHYCRPYSWLAEMRIGVADKKKGFAAKVLDG